MTRVSLEHEAAITKMEQLYVVSSRLYVERMTLGHIWDEQLCRKLKALHEKNDSK